MQHEWGRVGMHIGYWWESQKDRDHWEDQDVDVWTISKWILDRQNGMVGIGSIYLRTGTGGGLM
jgi:hypothetical protein